MMPKKPVYYFRCCLVFAFYVIGSLLFMGCAIYALLFGGVGRYFPLDQPRVALLYRLTDPEGMKSVVGAMGLVGLALSYVNTARTHKVKGLLMNDVIRYHYPFYGCVFISYGAFALLGRYCWSVGARTAGVWCLLGLLFGLVYQIRMAWKVSFSEKQSEKLATSYIKDMVADCEKRTLDDRPTREIHSVARYISRRFIEENRRFADAAAVTISGKNSAEADQDIRSLLKLLDDSRNTAAANWRRKTDRHGIVGDFDYLFYLNSNEGKAEKAFSLRKKTASVLYGLPSFQKSVKRFGTQVRMTADTWRNVLSEAGDPFWQVHIVCQILNVSVKQVPSMVTPLCCGLILCLHEMNIRNADLSGARQWNSCADFLSQMTQLIENSRLREEDRKTVSVLRIMCRDMVAMFLCLSYLDQAGTFKKVPDRPFRIILIEMQGAQTDSDAATRWDDQVIRIYLCYAYLIQSLLPMASPDNLSYADRERINTLIVEAIGNWFNSDVWEEGWIDAEETDQAKKRRT